MTNGNLSPILHRLATIHPLRTNDGRTTTIKTARPLLKYGRLKSNSQ